MVAEKLTLQALFPEKKLLSLEECLSELQWTYTQEGTSYNDIHCSCGTTVKCGGWIGTEHAWCPSCGKGMQDITGILPHGNSTVTHIDFDKVEEPVDGRIWIAENVWGYGREKED